jgi:hypothetical protein
MPYPRSRSYATPEEAFGIAQKPLESWFDAAASGMTRTGPAFSQSFEDATLRNQQRELEQERLRRQLESEQAASAFLQRAAGERPDALMQMIAEDPAILGSQDAPMIRDYIATRQQVQQQRQAQQPLSNKTLGPAIAKSITDPIQRMKFEQRLAAGEEATDAYESIQNEAKAQAQQAERRRMAIDALKAGAIRESDFDSIINDPDAERRLAAAMGEVSSNGKTGKSRDLLDEADRLEGLIEKAQNAGAPERAEVYQKMLDDLFKSPSAPDKPKVDDIDTTGDGKEKVAPPSGIQIEPLSEFEKNRSTAINPADQRRKALESEWTGAKDQTVESITKDTGIKPERLMSLSQAALRGQPLEGASKQEQEMAKMIAQYALRTVEGKPIQIGVDYGEGGVTPRLQNPANALLERMGVDPFEDIEIPGAGFMGGKKTMKAWELMELRLKEIAKPILADQKAATNAAEMSDKVKKGLDALEGSGNTPK